MFKLIENRHRRLLLEDQRQDLYRKLHHVTKLNLSALDQSPDRHDCTLIRNFYMMLKTYTNELDLINRELAQWNGQANPN